MPVLGKMYLGGTEIAKAYLGSVLVYSAEAEAPTAVDDTATVTAGQTIAIDVLANDEGDNLEISEIGGAYAAYASIETSDGSVEDWHGATIPNGRQYISFTTTLAA